MEGLRTTSIHAVQMVYLILKDVYDQPPLLPACLEALSHASRVRRPVRREGRVKPMVQIADSSHEIAQGDGDAAAGLIG